MSLEKFIRQSDHLVVFEASLNDKDFPMSSVFSLEVHQEELASIWGKLKESYERCLADIEGELSGDDGAEERVEITTVTHKYSSAYVTYCRCNTRIRELIQELSASATVPKSGQASFGFKLPPCEIPFFEGDYSAWPTFRDMFEAVCIRNTRLSSVEKLFHLHQKTKGEANDIVRRLPLTGENFQVAWASLCSRYENKRVLINIQLKKLFGLSAISNESASNIKILQRDINSCISLLKLYEVDVDSWDPIFVFVCSNCLPNVTLTLWEQTLSDKSCIPKWSKLDSFLTNRHRTLESVSEIRKPVDTPSSSSKPGSKTCQKSNPKFPSNNIRAFQNKVTEPVCHLCPKENHIIRKCPKFLKMTQAQRFSEIKKNSLCINCFSKVHTVKNCSSKFSCYKCNKKHNTLLHKDDSNSPSSPSAPSPSTSSLDPNSAPFHANPIQSTSSSQDGVVQTYFATNSKGVLLGTALVKVSHNGLTYRAKALVDSGSEGTFISERLFNVMKLPFKRTSATISGLNQSVSASVRKECTFSLGSCSDSSIDISTSALVVPHLSGSLPSRTIDPALLSELPNIPLADPNFFQSSQIDVLIGADIIPFVMLSGIQNPICGSLLAQETVFGWILTGPIPIQTTSSFTTIVSNFCEISLEKQISRFWEVEEPPRRRFMSPADQLCEDLFTRSTTRDSTGRYIVSLPFRREFPGEINLGESRRSSMAQFLKNESRLLRTPDFKREYDDVLEEYISLGHMRVVSSSNPTDFSHCYYLPHHAVIKPESTTTKVRVVFNASSSTSNGTSLNDVLLIGPVLQNDLTILILKWRFFQFVFNGDITKMYRQILVDEKHTPFQRILFRRSPNCPIQDYELKTVTFGVNCAPYLAIRTLCQLAEDVRTQYPLASDILRNYMYVDDALVGAHTVSDAKEAKGQLVKALKSAGFTMRKWTANCREILSDIPQEDLLREDFLKFDDSSTAKALGIRWNAMSDCFFFSIQPFSESTTFSKRKVLSEISKLFDPAGWLSPCIVVAKIIMQSIWMEKMDWDDDISPQTLSQWRSFQTNYPIVNSVSIPRWIHYSPDCEVQFHGFCDASEKAYAAALYIRVKASNSILTTLISSKTRVAPIKTLSIPRLELCGAALLAEMIDNIIPQMNVPAYTVHCWTDSTIVLSWLAKPPCYWTTFVANRVSKISEVIHPSKWAHVPSESNPADMASRGICPQEIVDNDLWKSISSQAASNEILDSEGKNSNKSHYKQMQAMYFIQAQMSGPTNGGTTPRES
ncbi:uncharacterized protein LOC131996228 [Stomoxys calcitrans]|uniref:uncharacterized protein LOC131996228 n=1 Tax=Stomoxys calcitrans TaxID=35570 RepID=UPI0027E2789E|nr:uncharacterized protein LOC131996228 [Stomoxys calcitrans]